jgi:hypothetical protein
VTEIFLERNKKYKLSQSIIIEHNDALANIIIYDTHFILEIDDEISKILLNNTFHYTFDDTTKIGYFIEELGQLTYGIDLKNGVIKEMVLLNREDDVDYCGMYIINILDSAIAIYEHGVINFSLSELKINWMNDKLIFHETIDHDDDFLYIKSSQKPFKISIESGKKVN